MADKYLKVTFQFNEADLKRFNKLLEDSDIQAKKLEEDLDDIGKQSTESFNKAANGLNQIVTGVKAFLALEAVNYLKNLATEASKVAAAGEGIRSAFGNLGLTTQNLKDFRDAVGGAMSDIQLMQIAVKAVNKGLGTEGLTKILEYADKQADATGGSLEQLADIMINSIGKQSTKGLQMAGLSIKEIEKNAEKLGFMPALMDEIGRKSAALGTIVGETGDSYDRLAASQANLMEAFGRVVNSGPFNQMKDFISNELTKLADFMNDPQGLGTKFAGQSNLDLINNFQNSQKKTAELEDQYTKTRNPIKLSRLRDELENEKELRLQIIDELNKRKETKDKATRDAEKKAAQEQLEADLMAAEELLAKQEEMDKKAKERRLEREQALTDALAAIEEQRRLGFLGIDQQAINDVAQQIDIEEAIKDLESFTPETEVADVVEFETSTEAIKLNLEGALGAMFGIYDLMSGLNDEEKGPKKFLKILTALLGIAGTAIPGLGTGFKIFTQIAGGIGARLNEGGVVPGYGPDRDSVPALLTPQEYVVRRRAAKRSALLLDAINSEQLDDSLFKQLASGQVTVNVDQDKVVKAIESMPQIDFYKNGSILYEVRKAASSKRVNRLSRIVP